MTEPLFFLSGVWILATGIFEISRKKAFKPFDFLSVANALFVVNFALAPLGYAMWPGYADAVNAIFSFDDFQPLPPNGIWVTAISMAGHFIVIAAYLTVVRAGRAHLEAQNSSFERAVVCLGKDGLLLVALALGALGLAALIAYSISLGGPIKMMLLSTGLRAGAVIAQYGFLKIISLLLIPAFYIALSKALAGEGNRLYVWIALAVLFGTMAFAVLMHDMGRMQLAFFILVPFLAIVVMRGIRVRVWLPVLLGFGWLTYATLQPLMAALVRGGRGAWKQDVFFNTVGDFWKTGIDPLLSLSSVIKSVGAFLGEMSFPYHVFTAYLSAVPEVISYRGLDDFFAAAVLLMPSFLAGGDPEYILGINLQLFHGQPIPVDLLSLGYVAAGGFGVVGLALGYGFVLGLCELIFGASRAPIGMVFRLAWMFYMPWWLMYADPMNAVKRGFGLIVVMMLLFLFSVCILPVFRRQRDGAGSPKDDETEENATAGQ